MDTLNAILTAAADAIFAPLRVFSPLGALIILSLLTGVLMTLAFRYTSNQQALRRVADKTRASLLAVRLFRDDLTVTLRAQVALLKATGLRLLHSLRPMAVMIVPFFFVLVQLALRFEHRPPAPGEDIVVQAEIIETSDQQGVWSQWSEHARLDVPAGLSNEFGAEPLRDTARSLVEWRLRADRPVRDMLRLRCGGATVEKMIVVSGDATELPPVSPLRTQTGWWERLLNPAEAALLPDGAVRRITIQVFPRETPVFGLDIPWWATYLVLSIVFALLSKPFLRVQF